MKNNKDGFEVRRILKTALKLDELILDTCRRNKTKTGEILNNELQIIINASRAMVILTKVACMKKKISLEIEGDQDLKNIGSAMIDLLGILKRRQFKLPPSLKKMV